MRFFIDTANVEEIRKANDMGVICGVTTNPSLIAKEGRDYAETLKEIASIVDGPISGEVKATTEDAETMIEEGRAIYALDPEHMVVKIPMTAEGLKAIKVLSAEGIPTNCTLIFSANQALLAARAGATYVSPFLGRLDDINESHHINLESEDYDSIGGYIIEQLDCLPKEGQSVTLESGIRLVVDRLDKNRIELVHIWLPEKKTETEEQP